MALDLEEQEQVEALKAWWKQHGTRVVVALTVFVVAVGGLRAWQVWSARQAAEASQLFERAMQALSVNDVKAVKEVTGQIMEHHGRSAYASPAAWLAGKVNYETDDVKSAQAQYEYALDHAKDEGLKQLARLRLAALRFDQKDLDGALKLLADPPAPAFAGLHASLRGDILVAQGKAGEARAAYQLALEKLGEKSPLKPLVEIKLDSLGG
jgi:predicted negative regulator of RcsB-dependent stress response